MNDARARIDELEAEVARWKQIALDPTVLIADDGEGVDIQLRHALVATIVDSFASYLGDAPNYVSMDGVSAKCGRVIITVQRAGGKSPQDLAAEYRARLEAMGVTDLAPLRPPPEKHQPNPVHEPHLFINARLGQFECSVCSGTAPCPRETTGTRWSALLEAFKDLHRGCEPKEKP